MGDAMSGNQRLQDQRAPKIVRPTCPKCANFMDVIPLVPGLGHLANRIFECLEKSKSRRSNWLNLKSAGSGSLILVNFFQEVSNNDLGPSGLWAHGGQITAPRGTHR
jgi:hypothetical protein